MALLFGNIVNVFVNFGTALSESNNDFSNPTVIATGRSFKHRAAGDAAGLVYIGFGVLIATYIYMLIWTHNGKSPQIPSPDAHTCLLCRRNLSKKNP